MKHQVVWQGTTSCFHLDWEWWKQGIWLVGRGLLKDALLCNLRKWGQTFFDY